MEECGRESQSLLTFSQVVNLVFGQVYLLCITKYNLQKWKNRTSLMMSPFQPRMDHPPRNSNLIRELWSVNFLRIFVWKKKKGQTIFFQTVSWTFPLTHCECLYLESDSESKFWVVGNVIWISVRRLTWYVDFESIWPITDINQDRSYRLFFLSH